MKKKDPTSHRIIEKRRRDRINSCLAELSRLIPDQYIKKRSGRVEKIEIIEMAIRRLRDLTETTNSQQRLLDLHQSRSGANSQHQKQQPGGNLTAQENHHQSLLLANGNNGGGSASSNNRLLTEGALMANLIISEPSKTLAPIPREESIKHQLQLRAGQLHQVNNYGGGSDCSASNSCNVVASNPAACIKNQYFVVATKVSEAPGNGHGELPDSNSTDEYKTLRALKTRRLSPTPSSSGSNSDSGSTSSSSSSSSSSSGGFGNWRSSSDDGSCATGGDKSQSASAMGNSIEGPGEEDCSACAAKRLAALNPKTGPAKSSNYDTRTGSERSSYNLAWYKKAWLVRSISRSPPR